MAVIKCKMCGGDLNIQQDSSIAECEYCGSRQTVPTADDEKKMQSFARAERLRRSCQFDKAAGVYEGIIADFPQEAEAYWGSVLCRYGIEYVDDPGTGRKVPTCHRSSYESILDDKDYEMALENADVLAGREYRREASQIEEIRKGILAVSSKEAPYDIFICYKETDEKGDRTIDSVIAQEIYNELMQKSYRVFFARITLEDKIGSEYESYIFAALNSAKIMLVIGTSYENLNAVWVRNEWSRFLSMMSAGQKKTLIPCYKGMDAYDMPKEFLRLQAQDLSKVGATQDLLRGIDKILGKDPSQQNAAAFAGVGLNSQAKALVRRGQIYLEDKKWDDAEATFDRALDNNPELAEAYLGKLLIWAKASTLEELKNWRLTDWRVNSRSMNELDWWAKNGSGQDPQSWRYGWSGSLDSCEDYAKIIRFGRDELKTQITEIAREVFCRNALDFTQKAHKDMQDLQAGVGLDYEPELEGKTHEESAAALTQASNLLNTIAARYELAAYKLLCAATLYNQAPGYRDADAGAKLCGKEAQACLNICKQYRERGEVLHKDAVYESAMQLYESAMEERQMSYRQWKNKFEDDDSNSKGKKASGGGTDAAGGPAAGSQGSEGETKPDLLERLPNGYEEAAKQFRSISGWKDADEKAEMCERCAEGLGKMRRKYHKRHDRRTMMIAFPFIGFGLHCVVGIIEIAILLGLWFCLFWGYPLRIIILVAVILFLWFK